MSKILKNKRFNLLLILYKYKTNMPKEQNEDLSDCDESTESSVSTKPDTESEEEFDFDSDESKLKMLKNLKYDYAIGFALDNEAPEYYLNYSTVPINIKRDGTMWTIPANNKLSYNFDQNPNAKYQWTTKKALNEGYKPTEEELKLGMEVSSQNTGLIYLTFMVFRKFKPEPVTRGATRCSGATISSTAARFGYGNEASSASVKSEFEYATGTEKYVLPIRLRIYDESAISNINCSRHLEGASLNALRRKTMTVPF